MSRSPIQNALLQRLGPITELPDNSYQVTITFDKDFLGFKGHFPDHPIVPGVCEISLVELLAQLVTGNDALRTKRITHVKFHNPILPGDCATFTFSVRKDADEHTIVTASISTTQNPNMATIKLVVSD